MEVIVVKKREDSIMKDLHTIIEENNNTIQTNVVELEQKDDLLKQKDGEIERLRAEIRLKQNSDVNFRTFDYNSTNIYATIGVAAVFPIIASIFFRSK